MESELKSTHQLQDYTAFPYGVLSIATYVKNNTGAKVKIFDYNINKNIEETIEEFKPTIIALSMMFDISYKYISSIISQIIKTNRRCQIVIGGMAATSSYKEILNDFPDITSVCYYEGEIPVAGIVLGKDAYDIFDAWITRDKLSKGFLPRKNVIKNLDDIIDLDYSLVNIENYPMVEAFSPNTIGQRNKKQFYIVSSRGCPFECTFCSHSADSDKTMRYASVQSVISHVKDLVTKYQMNVLTFYDDQFLLDKKRAKEIFKQLAQFNLRVEFPNGVSVAFVDEEMVQLMHAAGVDTILLAIESGSPRVLKEIIKKPLRLEQVKPAVDIFHKYGMTVIGFIVAGMPGETDEDRDMTVKFFKDSGIDWASVANATPIMGTELYNECIEKGYIPENMKNRNINMKNYIITTPNLSPEDLMKKSYQMNLDINFVNNHAMATGNYHTAIKMFNGVLERDPNHAFAYYYISICAKKIYQEICENDKNWEDRSKYFGLEINK